MSTPQPAPNSITIDVLRDLQNASHLKQLLTDNRNAIFGIASELAQFSGQPVSKAAAASPSAQITLQAAANWKTSTGIGFSLNPSAACKVSISTTTTKFPVAKRLDDTATEDIMLGPTTGVVYVNIDLDFDIKGSVSGSGTVSGIGISGKASGSAVATLSYCHPVASEMETAEALRAAFSRLVLPFEPDTALVMPESSLAKVNFDGSLACELDVTYGLGSFKFSAPGVDSAKQSLQVGIEKFTLPSVSVDVGAKATFKYAHTDHFGALIEKTDAQTAFLYVMRSRSDETTGSAGIMVGVSVDGSLGATIDKNALSQAVNRLTGGGGDQVAAEIDDLQNSLTAKANQWLSGKKGDFGLVATLDRQSNRAVLFKLAVDLAHADLTKQSWGQFAAGDLKEAMHIGGVSVLSGSGAVEHVQRSITIDLHFFNLFKFTDVATYFRRTRVEIGPDGSVRFFADIGKEQSVATKNTLKQARLHFVATATGDAAGDPAHAEVDLRLELSATNKRDGANRIADAIGSLPPSRPVQAAQTAMRSFVSANPRGTLTMIVVLTPSAYERLGCSAYTGPHHDIPPALPQEQDQDNWNAFHDAAMRLEDLSFLPLLSYAGWKEFNIACNGITNGVPDREHPGNTQVITPNFSGPNLQSFQPFVVFFYRSSADFMNLCDDLHALAGLVGHINTDSTWDSLLTTLTGIVQNDFDTDWSKSVLRALLQLCGGGPVSIATEPTATTFASTVTLT